MRAVSQQSLLYLLSLHLRHIRSPLQSFRVHLILVSHEEMRESVRTRNESFLQHKSVDLKNSKSLAQKIVTDILDWSLCQQCLLFEALTDLSAIGQNYTTFKLLYSNQVTHLALPDSLFPLMTPSLPLPCSSLRLVRLRMFTGLNQFLDGE